MKNYLLEGLVEFYIKLPKISGTSKVQSKINETFGGGKTQTPKPQSSPVKGCCGNK